MKIPDEVQREASTVFYRALNGVTGGDAVVAGWEFIAEWAYKEALLASALCDHRYTNHPLLRQDFCVRCFTPKPTQQPGSPSSLPGMTPTDETAPEFPARRDAAAFALYKHDNPQSDAKSWESLAWPIVIQYRKRASIVIREYYQPSPDSEPRG